MRARDLPANSRSVCTDWRHVELRNACNSEAKPTATDCSESASNAQGHFCSVIALELDLSYSALDREVTTFLWTQNSLLPPFRNSSKRKKEKEKETKMNMVAEAQAPITRAIALSHRGRIRLLHFLRPWNLLSCPRWFSQIPRVLCTCAGLLIIAL